MKVLPILFLALSAACLAQEEVILDPTRASPRMKAALLGGSAIPDLSVKGLVISAAREGGAVILEAVGGARVFARSGMPFTIVADGEARRLVIKRIATEGIEIEAPEQNETAIIPSFATVQALRSGLPGEVEYVEFRDLPLLEALRMLSDQTGYNYSASVEANKIAVNATLRSVPANSVVEEICKSHGLYYRRDETSGIVRIMTVGEFEKDLVGFREEQTVVFTLKYPNVPEVATAIADLFGDRVQLSLGAEETDEGALRDLESRFDRFEALTQRSQNSNMLNGNIVGGNVNGFVSNGGVTSGFGSNTGSRFRSGYEGGSSRSRIERRTERGSDASQAEEDLFRTLTPEQAQRIERATAGGRRSNEVMASVEALRLRPATIYVTASRRNNIVAVRTADSRAMADIRALVEYLDVQTPMVLLEVKVLSIELGRGFESAFEYQISDGRFGGSFTSGAINPSLSRDPITGDPNGVIALPGVGSSGLRDGHFMFQFLGDSVRARLQLLESKNRVKTIASPTLLTANNEISRLFLGEERPLVRGVSSQTIITDNNVATTPNTLTEFRNVGNTLLITPNINSDRTVTLRLVQENSFISPNAASIPVVTTGENNRRRNNNNNNNDDREDDPVTGVQNVPVDVIGTRSVSGTFVAKDGMAVAIGGLIEDVDIDRRSQVPLLGDIPGLGLLFRRQNKEKSRRELVVIIRPYVMSTPADSERISRAVLERLAPASVEKLVEEGFLPEALPVQEVVRVERALPVDPSEKKVVSLKKSSRGR